MSEQVLVKTFETSSDVPKHRFVTLQSNDKVIKSTNNAIVLGANCGLAAAVGERIDVGVIGIFDVEASDAINAGATVGAAANGKAKTQSSGNKAGVALSSSSADGDLVRVLIRQ